MPSAGNPEPGATALHIGHEGRTQNGFTVLLQLAKRQITTVRGYTIGMPCSVTCESNRGSGARLLFHGVLGPSQDPPDFHDILG